MKHPIIIKSNQLILLERLYLKGSAIAYYYDIGVQGLIKAGIVIPINNHNIKNTDYLERLVVTKAGKQFLNRIFKHNANQTKVKNNFKRQTHIIVISIIAFVYFIIQFALHQWLGSANNEYASEQWAKFISHSKISSSHYQLAKHILLQKLKYLHHFNSNDYNFYSIHMHLTKWGLEALQSRWFPTVSAILELIGFILVIIVLSLIFTQHRINKNNRLIASQLTNTYFYKTTQKTKGINWNNDLISIFEYQRPKFIGDSKYYLEMYLN